MKAMNDMGEISTDSVTKTVLGKTIEGRKDMNTLLDEIANHLEFFGYAIEKKEREDAPNSYNYCANHERHYNIRFFEMHKNFVCFQICFWHDALAIDTSAMAETFNEFNQKSSLTKFYYILDRDDSRVLVHAEAIFIGDYTKQSFGVFYDRFKAEEKDAFVSNAYKNCFITKEEQNCVIQ